MLNIKIIEQELIDIIWTYDSVNPKLNREKTSSVIDLLISPGYMELDDPYVLDLVN